MRLVNGRHTVLPALFGLLVFLTLSGSASGHAGLESSVPPADALLATPPREIALNFTEPIELAAVTVTAVDERGQPIRLSAPRFDPDNNRRVLISSGDFSLGAFTVSWTNRSSTDGHTLSGSFAFRVGGTDRAPAAATVEGQRPAVWGVLTRWLTFLGAAPAVGLLLMLSDWLRRRIVSGALIVSLIATVLEPALLSLFPPAASTGGTMAEAIRAEPNGWWIRLGGLALALIVSLVP